MHVDRCEAVAAIFAARARVVGIELNSVSDVYSWNRQSPRSFEKLTLFSVNSRQATRGWLRLVRLLRTCLSLGDGDFFFCHYEYPEIFFTALILRVLRRNVFVMNDSKFDDKPRILWREFGKSIAYLPYKGALVSAERAKDYMVFLRFRAGRVQTGYDTLSIQRIRSAAAGLSDTPESFAGRHFTAIARLVEKKNLSTLLQAYARYARLVDEPRPLHICGNGHLEAALKAQALSLGIHQNVLFRGFLQSDEVAATLRTTLALMLPSIEEQFGLVVIEAQAMGIPVIYSPACGARDELLRTAVNGFMVEPDNPIGIAYYMEMISTDEGLWKRLSAAALGTADAGNVERFVTAVERLRGKA